MPEKHREDLPDHDGREAPDRFDLDGVRSRLFSGPGATLYGDSAVPAQTDWDSTEIPPIGGQGADMDDGGGSFFGEDDPLFGEADYGDDEVGSLVRPYTKTGGRTRTDNDLAIETLVSTSNRGKTPGAAVQQEHRFICGLCVETRSVAEVAAHLRLPLGVAKVLIGDMVGMGLVLIHQSGTAAGDRPSMELMERVLSGLRRL